MNSASRFDASTHPWNSLPLEIRLSILEFVKVSSADIEVAQGRKKHSLAPFASVCREWQEFFERATFRRLIIDQSDLPVLAKAVKGSKVIRLSYIRQLWLRMKLPRYTCRSCGEPEDGLTTTRHNRIFTTSIKRLLAVLSSWEPQHGGGLTLELSAQSPSDVEHCFAMIEVADEYPFRYEGDSTEPLAVLEYHRKTWPIVTRNSHYRYPRTSGEQKRFYGTPLELRPWNLEDKRGRSNPLPILPKAPIVKGFLLRRHFYRSIAISTLVLLFQQSFTAVDLFRFERWMSDSAEENKTFHHNFVRHLIPALPPSLKRFYCNEWRRTSERGGGHVSKIDQLYLVQAVARYCRGLTEFSMPWPLDALEFLQHFVVNCLSWPYAPLASVGPPEWTEIESLCIRSTWLHPDYGQRRVTYILELAGRAARSMPKLRTLEIWNIKGGFCYLFRYTIDQGNAKIVWRCFGRQFSLEPRVVETWAKTASARTQHQLSVDVGPFPDPAHRGLLFKGVFLYRNLALRRLVFDPVSLDILEASILASR